MENSESSLASARVAAAPSPAGGTDAARRLLYVAIVGHVDHGKSTLVGRLLHETGALPEGKVEAVEAMCRRRGMPFEWAFVTDALQAERDQGITIDVSHIRFRTASRPYVLVDAPGHREFLKNMISGAALADAALLVIDAIEGVRDQSKRHGYLLHLLGVRQVVVAVNKMDLVDYDQARFAAIETEYRAYLKSLGVEPRHVVPISARHGDNVATPSPRMAWYRGPTVLAAVDGFVAPLARPDLPLRLPVQDVYKFDERRIIAGRIESGRARVGDTLLFSPSNKTARLASFETVNRTTPMLEASAGESVGFTLDDQIFVERGEVVSLLSDPPIETNVFRARIFWLGAKPMRQGDAYTLKLHTLSAPVRIETIERVVDTGDLSARAAGQVERNGIAEVVISARRMLALDAHDRNPHLGRFVLVDGYDVVGGGIINMEGYPDQRQAITVRSTNLTEVAPGVSAEARARHNGHTGGVLWLTGLSGAGKSTLAVTLERLLFQKGYQVYVLDGDNVRNGLNANLGFSPEDRAENIRRVGEVAALFADAGLIVITSFISPYRADRDRARAAAKERFHEIYVRADLATCEERDPKGLYKRARAGQIRDFTGISAPYEPPSDPQLVVDTGVMTIDESVSHLLAYIERHFRLARAT